MSEVKVAIGLVKGLCYLFAFGIIISPVLFAVYYWYISIPVLAILLPIAYRMAYRRGWRIKPGGTW